MRKRLAIVVLNYHQPDLTIECLESVANEVDVNRDVVVVVENGSNDDSAERIEAAMRRNQWQDWLRVVHCTPNRGFAGGNNVGILAQDAEYYILLNNDTIVRPGTFAALLSALEARPHVGLIGPSMENRAGQLSASCFQDVNPVTEFLSAAMTGACHVCSVVTTSFASFQPSQPRWTGLDLPVS